MTHALGAAEPTGVYEIEAVGLDVFGTLIEYPIRLNPYRRLMYPVPNPKPHDWAALRHDVLTRNRSPVDLAIEMGCEEQGAHICSELDREVAAMRLFPDAIEVLASLRRRGLRLAICSNLAQGYGEVVRRLIADSVDVSVLSFEVGLVKPDARIFDMLVRRLNVDRARTLFVGDSLNSDVRGAWGAGLRARHLCRSKGQTLKDVLDLRW